MSEIFIGKFSRTVLSGLLIMSSALILSACGVIEPEPEVNEVDPEEEAGVINDQFEKEPEETIGEILLILPPTANHLTVSNDGDFLIFTMAGAPIDPYHIINTKTYRSEIVDGREVSFDDIEALPTPGLEPGQVNAPEFSPDGEKLLYAAYEAGLYRPGEHPGAIYISCPGLPPEIYHQVDLSEDEIVPDIRPVWKADGEGIYYLSTRGVMSYSPEAQQAELVHTAEDLSGPLDQNTGLAPHSFLVKDNFARLAYAYEGEIEIVPFKNDHLEWERFETGLTEISNIEFIFDGRYLALESAFMYDIEGQWLEFLDLQTGELVELDNNYLPAGYTVNDQQEMAFIKFNQAGDFELAILNELLEEVQTASLPRLTGNVIWLDSAWCVLGSGQDGYPLYKIEF